MSRRGRGSFMRTTGTLTEPDETSNAWIIPQSRREKALGTLFVNAVCRPLLRPGGRGYLLAHAAVAPRTGTSPGPPRGGRRPEPPSPWAPPEPPRGRRRADRV